MPPAPTRFHQNQILAKSKVRFSSIIAHYALLYFRTLLVFCIRVARVRGYKEPRMLCLGTTIAELGFRGVLVVLCSCVLLMCG